MSVFRRKLVFRDNRETGLLGSLTLITASTVAASIVFAGSASGNTSTTTGDATGTIVFAGSPLSEIVLEVSGTGACVFAGPATGVQRNLGGAVGTIAYAGSARCDALGSGAIVFGGSATVGSIFTMDASGSIVYAGTATSPARTSDASGSIVFSGTSGSGLISGGTITVAASGEIAFSGTAIGDTQSGVTGAIEFGGTAEGVRFRNTRTPRCRTYIVELKRRR